MIGKTIRDLRKKAGISQEEAAKLSGFTQARLSQIESDKSSPSIDKIIPVLKVYGMTLAVLPEGLSEDLARQGNPVLEVTTKDKI